MKKFLNEIKRLTSLGYDITFGEPIGDHHNDYVLITYRREYRGRIYSRRFTISFYSAEKLNVAFEDYFVDILKGAEKNFDRYIRAQEREKTQ